METSARGSSAPLFGCFVGWRALANRRSWLSSAHGRWIGWHLLVWRRRSSTSIGSRGAKISATRWTHCGHKLTVERCDGGGTDARELREPGSARSISGSCSQRASALGLE